MRGAILILLAFHVVACDERAAPDASTTDGGMTKSDGGRTDSSVDADGGSPDGGSFDASPADAGGPLPPASRLLLVAQTSDSSGVLGSAFRDGAWDSFTDLAPGVGGVGGVTVLADGRGMAIVGLASGLVGAAFHTEAGGWTAAIRFDDGLGTTWSEPAPTAEGVFVARMPFGDGDPVTFTAFDAPGSVWSTPEPTALRRQSLISELAAAQGDAPYVFVYEDSTNTYRWTTRVGTTWSAPEILPGGITASTVGSIEAVARANGSEVVATWVGGPDLARARLEMATFAGGVATMGFPLLSAPGVRARVSYRPHSMVSLGDGRIAIAVVARDFTPFVMILDGGFGQVTTDTVRFAAGGPIALARGTAGAVLELVYIDEAGQRLMHTRLTDETTWTWTAPAVFGDALPWTSVWLGAGP